MNSKGIKLSDIGPKETSVSLFPQDSIDKREAVHRRIEKATEELDNVLAKANNIFKSSDVSERSDEELEIMKNDMLNTKTEMKKLQVKLASLQQETMSEEEKTDYYNRMKATNEEIKEYEREEQLLQQTRDDVKNISREQFAELREMKNPQPPFKNLMRAIAIVFEVPYAEIEGHPHGDNNVKSFRVKAGMMRRILSIRAEDLRKDTILKARAFLAKHPEVTREKIWEINKNLVVLEPWLRTILAVGKRLVIEGSTLEKAIEENERISRVLQNELMTQETLKNRLTRLASSQMTLANCLDDVEIALEPSIESPLEKLTKSRGSEKKIDVIVEDQMKRRESIEVVQPASSPKVIVAKHSVKNSERPSFSLENMSWRAESGEIKLSDLDETERDQLLASTKEKEALHLKIMGLIAETDGVVISSDKLLSTDFTNGRSTKELWDVKNSITQIKSQLHSLQGSLVDCQKSLMTDQEKAKFNAQKMKKGLEVATLKNDTKLLQDTQRQLEKASLAKLQETASLESPLMNLKKAIAILFKVDEEDEDNIKKLLESPELITRILNLKPEEVDMVALSRVDQFLAKHPEVNFEQISKIDISAGVVESWLRTILRAGRRAVIENRTLHKAIEDKSALSSALLNDTEDGHIIRNHLKNIEAVLDKIESVSSDTDKALGAFHSSTRSVVLIKLEDHDESPEESKGSDSEKKRVSRIHTDRSEYYQSRATVVEINFGTPAPEIKTIKKVRTRRGRKKRYRLNNLHRNNPRKWRLDD